MMSKGAFACVFACKTCLFAKFQRGPQFHSPLSRMNVCSARSQADPHAAGKTCGSPGHGGPPSRSSSASRTSRTSPARTRPRAARSSSRRRCTSLQELQWARLDRERRGRHVLDRRDVLEPSFQNLSRQKENDKIDPAWSTSRLCRDQINSKAKELHRLCIKPKA